MLNDSDIKFANKKISKFINRNNKDYDINRLCVVISINDKNVKKINESHYILQDFLRKIQDSFWQSEIVYILEKYEPETKIKFLSKENHTTLVDYGIMIFNLPNHSAIEFLITTNSLSKNVIQREEDGETINYHSKLYADVKQFEEKRNKI